MLYFVSYADVEKHIKLTKLETFQVGECIKGTQTDYL